jgi:hypothetical protein
VCNYYYIHILVHYATFQYEFTVVKVKLLESKDIGPIQILQVIELYTTEYSIQKSFDCILWIV